MGYTLTGSLFDLGHTLVSKGKFHVYDQANHFLALGKTSSDGRFKVVLPDGLEKNPSLIFRLCVEEKPIFSHPAIHSDPGLARVFFDLKDRKEVGETVRQVTLDAPNVDVGEVEIEEHYDSEHVPLSYMADIVSSGAGAALRAGIETLKEKVDFFGMHGVGEITTNFGVTPVPLTQENTWKLVQNGICPMYLKRIGPHLVADINFDRYEFDKGESLPSIRVEFDDSDKESPKIVKIEVQFRKTLHPSSREEDKEPVKIYKPSEPDFEEGLRIANSVFHVFGQTTFHLAIGHVYGMKVAQYVHDHLQGTKLGEFLLPHCQYIRKISNELGKASIFGEEGILNVSALSVKGIALLISDSLAALDPFTFKPRAPMSEEHHFAKVQHVHYDMLKGRVNEYLDAHWGDMLKHWDKIHAFFVKVHKYSPNYRTWAGEPTDIWIDASEIGGVHNPEAPSRTKFKPDDEEVRSMRHIARNEQGPEGNDRQMIAAFVADFLHHVTLWHSWIHGRQYAEDDVAPNVLDPNFSPITLSNFGRAEFGGINEADAIHQHRIGKTFRDFPVEKYALVNSDRANKVLIERIKELREKYLACGGFDPFTKLAVSTVI